MYCSEYIVNRKQVYIQPYNLFCESRKVKDGRSLHIFWVSTEIKNVDKYQRLENIDSWRQVSLGLCSFCSLFQYVCIQLLKLLPKLNQNAFIDRFNRPSVKP